MRILFVHKQILFPRDTGGKIRVLNLLKHLARWHDVTYVSNLRPGEERHLDEMKSLGLKLEMVAGETSKREGVRFYAEAMRNLFSPYPLTVARNFDPALKAKVVELLKSGSFDLVICDTVVMALHTMGLSATASILFQHNVEAQILKRHAEVSTSAKRLFMKDQHRKMSRFEASCGPQFDAVIAVSEQDKRLFECEYGWKHCRAIETAVDVDFFNDQTGEIPGRVTFLGSMDWMPNQDGVKWFVTNVWPIIHAEKPDAKFYVVGRNPPADVSKLGQVAGVKIVGGVPDVRPYLAETNVFVVPLLVGGGTRLKIFEAMASGRAVVSTTIGAEGLPIAPGEHYLSADDPKQFAEAVVKLLSERAVCDRVRKAGYQFVRSRYASEPVARQFERICIETVAAKETALGVH